MNIHLWIIETLSPLWPRTFGLNYDFGWVISIKKLYQNSIPGFFVEGWMYCKWTIIDFVFIFDDNGAFCVINRAFLCGPVIPLKHLILQIWIECPILIIQLFSLYNKPISTSLSINLSIIKNSYNNTKTSCYLLNPHMRSALCKENLKHFPFA